MIIKSHFHKKGFALGLVLKQRLAASRKWPIHVGLHIKRSGFELFGRVVGQHAELSQCFSLSRNINGQQRIFMETRLLEMLHGR